MFKCDLKLTSWYCRVGTLNIIVMLMLFIGKDAQCAETYLVSNNDYMSGDSQSYDNTTVGFSMSGNMAPPTLVNKCMSTHLKANVSLESNANANANVIFRNAFKYK